MQGTVFKWTEHPEQLDETLLSEQLDDPFFAEQLDIIRGRKIYVGEKLLNFYWCLG